MEDDEHKDDRVHEWETQKARLDQLWSIVNECNFNLLGMDQTLNKRNYKVKFSALQNIAKEMTGLFFEREQDDYNKLRELIERMIKFLPPLKSYIEYSFGGEKEKICINEKNWVLLENNLRIFEEEIRAVFQRNYGINNKGEDRKQV